MRKPSPQKTAKQIYLESFVIEDHFKIHARESALELNKEGISLSSIEAQTIKLLASLVSPNKIVEIGTLTGLSALYLAEALLENNTLGKAELWTLEKDPIHYEKAKLVLSDFCKAHSKLKINALLGDAREELLKLQDQGPFCVVFIDANKAAYMEYFKWADQNLRPGGLIIADNVFLSGAVWGDSSEASQKFNIKQVQVMRDLNQELMTSKNYLSTLISTEEGLLAALKRK